MRIGIIETGKPSASLLAKYGDYPQMFAKMLQSTENGFETFSISVVAGEPLPNAASADGWLITGSRHGAYDDLPWIAELKEFINKCVSSQIPMIGVCFGHQIIAEALGGKVEKSNKGWQVGPRNYRVSNKPAWMAEIGTEYSSHAIHQDQIIKLAEGSSVFAATEQCKYAAIVYGNPSAPIALTLQSHPELSAKFVADISKERLARVVSADVLSEGLQNLGTHVHNSEWAKTFRTYFQRSNGIKH